MSTREENNSTNSATILKYQKQIKAIKKAELVCTGFLLLAIIGSLIAIVVIQFVSDNPTYKEAAQICNTYTGIVLGFVAMTVSLIGMVLSFHNTKQAEESTLESAIGFTNLRNSVSEIADIEKNLSKTLEELERKTVDITRFKNIETQLEKLVSEMRSNFDMNKGSATDRATTTPAKRESSPEPMETDETQGADQKPCG